MKLAKYNVQIMKIECIKRSNQYKITTQYKDYDSQFNTGTWVANYATQIGVYLKEALGSISLKSGESYTPVTPITGTLSLSTMTRRESPGEAAGVFYALTNIDMDVDSLKTIRAQNQNSNTVDKYTYKGYTYIYAYMPQTKDLKSYVKGKCLQAIDGDTITIRITEAKGMPSDVVVGDNFSVRLVGVNCPEIKKEVGNWYSRNIGWAVEHNLEEPSENNGVMDKILAIANEGKAFTQTFSGCDVLIDPEGIDGFDKSDSFDTYGRLIGCVYADPAWDIPGNVYNAICLNTSLVANASKSSPEFALAEPTDKWSYNSSTGKYESKFPIFSWWYYAPNKDQKLNELKNYKEQKERKKLGGKLAFYNKYGLVESTDPIDSLDNLVEIVYNEEKEVNSGFIEYTVMLNDNIDSIAQMFNIKPTQIGDFLKLNNIDETKINASLKPGKTILIPTYKQASNSYNRDLWEEDKFINANNVPADCQYEDYENMIIDDRGRLDEAHGMVLYTPFHLRIGDSTFLVPPLSIRFDTMANNQRIQALRSKSSMQISTGYATTVITLDLFFPTLDSVNGYEYESPIKGKHYYRNGLRPLIAQFKKAPFLPIENELINEHYGIYSVVMRDMEISTVKGFPNCLQARLTLLEFDHTTYMPSEEDFASTFCWPLFRWYYQRALNPSDIPNKTYLKKLDRVDTSITFMIPDEKVLIERRKAIYDLVNKLAPSVYERANSEESSLLSQMKKEATSLKEGQEQYKSFKAALAAYPASKYPMLYNSVGVFDPVEFINEYENISKDMKDYQRYLDALPKILSDTYTKSKYTGMYFYPNRAPVIFNIIGRTVRDFTPTTGFETSDCYKDIVSATSFKEGGSYGIKFSSTNINKLKTNRKDSSGKYGVVDVSDYALISLIIGTSETQDLSITDYEMQFEKINAAAHMSEDDIPEVPFPIENIYIESATSAMHNVYAPLQLSSTESPTYQHMGASDTTIELTIRTKDRMAVERFRRLMSTAQRLSREYRIAITSGIVSIDTPLMQLAGTRSVLIERLSVETSQEDKESFLITISMISFDKTQRSPEDLNMIEALGAASDSDKTKALLEYSKRKRNSQGFEYTLIDFALKDLEIYPDLDLPTYEELNEDLPFLNIVYPDDARTKFNYYPNPDHARFVDPDFYIRCENTFKDYLYAMLEEGEVPTYLKDAMGFEAVEFGPTVGQQRNNEGMLGPNVVFSDETTQWINNNLASVYKGRSNANNDKRGWVYTGVNSIEQTLYEPKTTDATEASNGNIKADAPSYLYGKIDDKERPGMTKAAASKKPTVNEIIRWGYAGTVEGAQKYIDNLRDPTTSEFCAELEYLVRYKYFSKLDSDKAAIQSGATNVASYTFGKDRISAPKITQEKVINVLKAIFEQESGWKQFYSKDKIKWNSSNDLGIGQMNVYLSGVFRNVDEMRKAAWIWKYNMDRTVELFARTYNVMITQGGKYNADAPRNPLDWAIACYHMGMTGGLKSTLESTVNPNDDRFNYYPEVIRRFKNKYGADMIYSKATPNALVDQTVNNNVNAITQLNVMKGDTVIKQPLADSQKNDELKYEEALAKATGKATPTYGDTTNTQKFEEAKAKQRAKEAGDPTQAGYDSITIYLDRKVLQFVGDRRTIFCIDPNTPSELGKSKEYLDKRKIAKQNLPYVVKSAYWDGREMPLLEQFINVAIAPKIEDKSFDIKNNYVLIKSGAADAVEKAYGNGDTEFEALMKTSKNIFTIRNKEENAVEDVAAVQETQSVAAFLRAPDDVAVLYRKSFSDLLEFDHKGRMIRAFPTYQMFIIDEGRWMSFHKLWDNFYGYNSIMSIDLCKDRRIAADTAIISMTNIYNNLSMHDNEVSYGEWDVTLKDLIFGSSSDRYKVAATIFDLADRTLLEARSEEINSMMLAPGARIHLRMGYGANAYRLPVVFNGTVTEMNAGEMVTVIAQGDGVELCNKLKTKPGQKNIEGIFSAATEPRDYMCQMMTSKGNFFDNYRNLLGAYMVEKSDTSTTFGSAISALGQMLQDTDHPLGIVHFGASAVPAKTVAGWRDLFNQLDEHYGEP
jgi:hypothetical protein